jgi:ribosome-binding protein aMBF1 (putative translation factor)
VIAARQKIESEFRDRLRALDPESIENLRELFHLLRASTDDEERQEISGAIVEILIPESLEGIDSAAPSEEVRRRVDAYYRQVGATIRRRRQALRLTQAKLAALTGLPQSHISRLEHGQHAPTSATIERLATALKTTIESLDPGVD